MSHLDPAAICKAVEAPYANVLPSWSSIETAMVAAGIGDDLPLIAAAATVKVETGRFLPINELGGPAYFAKYDGRKDLGNTQPGDGARYHGRGFVQITGRANYRRYGHLLGIDLEAEPERALGLEPAARILAIYFRDRGVDIAARKHDWKRVRRAVNGGLNGWDVFDKCVRRLLIAFPQPE